AWFSPGRSSQQHRRFSDDKIRQQWQRHVIDSIRFGLDAPRAGVARTARRRHWRILSPDRNGDSSLMSIHPTPARRITSQGFSTVELLMVVVIILIVITYTLTTVVRGQKPALRANAARQLANYLEQARNDSARRRANAAAQMAQ